MFLYNTVLRDLPRNGHAIVTHARMPGPMQFVGFEGMGEAEAAVVKYDDVLISQVTGYTNLQFKDRDG